MPPKKGQKPLLSPEIPAVSTSGDDSDTFSKLVNTVYYDYLTVGITFSSYINSGVQTGSAQLARAKSTRVLAGGLAQMLIVRHTRTHAHSALCSPDVAP